MFILYIFVLFNKLKENFRHTNKNVKTIVLLKVIDKHSDNYEKLFLYYKVLNDFVGPGSISNAIDSNEFYCQLINIS